MGFHVSCSGADFIKELSQDANGFFGEPHALYMIGLATVVDEDALEWFLDYEMAFDSLTGHFAAFVLFYNRARLKVGYPDLGGYKLFPEYRSGDPIEVSLPAEVLRAGAWAVDDFLLDRPDVLIAKEIFVRSMTYESDAIARQLGIVDKLPCIVMFDDPRSDEFYLIPVPNREDSFGEIRKLLGGFIKARENAAFLNAIDEWHRIRREVGVLEAEVTSINSASERRTGSRTLDEIESALRRARLELSSAKPKAFRRTINGVAQFGLPWGELRSSSNRIARAVRLSNLFEFADEKELMDQYRMQACQLLEIDRVQGGSYPDHDLARCLRELVDEEVSEVMQRIYTYFGLPSDGSRLSDILTEKRKSIESLNIAAKGQLAVIEKMNRPSLSPQFKELQSEKRREIFIQKLRSSALTMADKGPSVMSAISGVTNILPHL